MEIASAEPEVGGRCNLRPSILFTVSSALSSQVVFSKHLIPSIFDFVSPSFLEKHARFLNMAAVSQQQATTQSQLRSSRSPDSGTPFPQQERSGIFQCHEQKGKKTISSTVPIKCKVEAYSCSNPELCNTAWRFLKPSN